MATPEQIDMIFNPPEVTPPPTFDATEALSSAVGAATAATSANVGDFSDISETVLNTVLEAVPLLDQATIGAFMGAMNDLDPNWQENIIGAISGSMGSAQEMASAFFRDAMPQVLERAVQASRDMFATADSYAAGEVTDEQRAYIDQQNAENTQAMGIYGQAAEFLGSGAIARQSVANMSESASLGAQAYQIAAAAYQGSANIQRSVVQAGNQAAGFLREFMPQPTDVRELFGSALGSVYAAGTLSPDQVMSTMMNLSSADYSNRLSQWQFLTGRADDIWGLQVQASLSGVFDNPNSGSLLGGIDQMTNGSLTNAVLADPSNQTVLQQHT